MITPRTDQPQLFRDRIEVVLRGDLPEVARGWAVEEVERAVTLGSLPLVRAWVTLQRPAPAAVPCRADITVDLDGHLIHGRSDARAPLAALHAAAGQVHTLAVALARRGGGPPAPDPGA
jgi:hypothetical protein